MQVLICRINLQERRREKLLAEEAARAQREAEIESARLRLERIVPPKADKNSDKNQNGARTSADSARDEKEGEGEGEGEGEEDCDLSTLSDALRDKAQKSTDLVMSRQEELDEEDTVEVGCYEVTWRLFEIPVPHASWFLI